jgi:hypothetical protein
MRDIAHIGAWAEALRKVEAQQKEERKPAVYLHKSGLLTPDEYDTMLAAQGGLCAICERPLKLFVDHNHQTSVVRALLCNGCNSGIGMLGDDASRCYRAAQYLDSYLDRIT